MQKLTRSRVLAAVLLLGIAIYSTAEEQPPKGLYVDHFMEEAQWIAAELGIDVGSDTGR